MYNAYIPQAEDFQPVEEDRRAAGGGAPFSMPFSAPSFFRDLFGGGAEKEDAADAGAEKNAGLAGILKALKLDRLDKGDILLILLVLYLVWEGKEDGDSKELLVILALALFLGL